MNMQSVIWIVSSLLSIVTLTQGSWGSPGDGQYHIQTDEGPERFFRFQTDNGQYRKEKRLQDGTVIGTEAWIDADGFLRQKDYIADTEGYRILKSKTVFVGQGRPIEDAIASTKTVPAQSGVLVDGSKGANSIHQTSQHKHAGYVYSTTPIPETTRRTTTESPAAAGGKLNYLSPAEAAQLQPSGYLGFDHYPDELPRRPHQKHIHRTHSAASETANYDENHNDFFASTARPLTVPLPSLPSLSMQPPLLSNYRRVRPIAVVPTTPAPITANEAAPNDLATAEKPYHFSSPAPFGTPATSGYFYAPQHTSPLRPSVNDDHQRGSGENAAVYSSTARPSVAVVPLEINSLEGLQPPHLPTHYRRPHPQPSLAQSNALGLGDAPEFDGIAVTRNGFRYYLPRQYHEEENVGEQKRAGSFGYIDPFGIRRVVYYNASPERGFVHRNNNQYVGFSARPYDSSPN